MRVCPVRACLVEDCLIEDMVVSEVEVLATRKISVGDRTLPDIIDLPQTSIMFEDVVAVQVI